MNAFVRRFVAMVGVLVMSAQDGAGQGNTSNTQGDVTVSGRVTNESGAPLAGVQVFIQGVGIGAQTERDGRYTFVVGSARAAGQTATLVARVIGYAAQTRAITLSAGSAVTQDYVLVANPLRLGEVVITGAGTATMRERVPYAINTVDSARIARSFNPQNIVSALTALAPNVEVRTHSGEPGSSASIRIRGIATISGSAEPLFVIDGQPIDNTTEATGWDGGVAASQGGTVAANRASDLNPADIESIEILKGSAAAAVYGARASNGVILITTKSGKPGAARYNVTSTTRWDQMDGNVALQREFGQGTGGVAPSGACTTGAGACTRAWGQLLAPGTPTYDHGKEIYRTGITSDYALSVSGGNERTTVYASGALMTQRGPLVGPNNRYNRTSVRLKADHHVNDKLTVGGNFNYIDARGRYVQKGSNISGLLLAALRTPPEFNNRPAYDPVSLQHRSYRMSQPGPGSDRVGRGYDNPFFVLDNSGNQSELGRSISNMNAQWTPWSWLDVRYTLGADYYNDWRLETLPLSSSNAPNGMVTRNDFNNLEIDHNLVATATRTFNDRLSGNLTVGQNLNSRRVRRLYILGDQLNAPVPYAIHNTLAFYPTEYRALAHVESYFAQGELDVSNQLFVTLGLRNDGFSTFGPGNRRATYPRAGLSWLFTNAYMPNEDAALGFGKLRLAWGQTGKEPPFYASSSALSSEVVFGSGFGDVLGTNQSGLGGLGTYWLFGNPDLKPERQTEFEVGTDMTFWRQKVDLSMTYYSKQSRDVILEMPINASQTGGLVQLGNGAAISNKGFELSLNLRPYTSRSSDVNVGIQFATNAGKVLNLAGNEYVIYGPEGFTGSVGSATVGYAPGVIRGYDFVRCGRGSVVGATNIDSLCAAESAPNGALYLAANGQPVFDPVERVIADPNPRYTMNYNVSVRFANKFRFTSLIDLRKGGEVYNGTRGSLYSMGTHADTRVRAQTGLKFGEDYYTDIYPHVVGPGVGVSPFNSLSDWETWFRGAGGTSGSQQQFIEDGSFVKLREISVSYTVDHPAIRSFLGFRSADIRVAGRNLHTWTRYRGLDPESNLQGAQTLTQGIDYFNNPQSRSFVLSISLNR